MTMKYITLVLMILTCYEYYKSLEYEKILKNSYYVLFKSRLICLTLLIIFQLLNHSVVVDILLIILTTILPYIIALFCSIISEPMNIASTHKQNKKDC